MKCDKIAKAILKHLAENKGVGNTRTILDGATRTRASVVVLDEDSSRSYRNIKPVQVISLSDVEEGALEARKGFPLAIDNAALVTILQGLVKEDKKKGSK